MHGKTENLHPELTELLVALEEYLGIDLTVVSGQRSDEHNLEVGGVPSSEHTYIPAEGVDVLCKQGVTRYKMLKWLFQHDVRRIGVGDTFLHIGIADDKPQFCVWLYE